MDGEGSSGEKIRMRKKRVIECIVGNGIIGDENGLGQEERRKASIELHLPELCEAEALRDNVVRKD